jgi:hypothetical protein
MVEENETPERFKPLVTFTLKLAIVLLPIGVFLSLVLPDFSKIHEGLTKFQSKIESRFKDERVKLYVLGLIQNPAALYKMSEIDAENGRMENAIRNIELAIGLLEMHGADKVVIKRYSDRLKEFKASEEKKKASPQN